MSRPYSSKEVEFVLRKLNFEFVSQTGSHGKFKNKMGRVVILPMNKREIPLGTLRSIVRQIGINVEAFKKAFE